jgi:NADH:ubiquinone oxidoreductase subunit 3 (subunit A)
MTHILHLDFITYKIMFVSILLGVLICAVILGLSYLLAIQAPDPEKTSAYECGFEPFEDARNKFDVRFYIIAILFLIFDLEVAYLFPWATTLALTGSIGYITIVIFLLLLTVGFVYEVSKGALRFS